MWSVSANPERFDDAAEFFSKRIPLTKELAEQIEEQAARRAFTVAGVAQLDIVQQVHASLLNAIETGIPFEEWKKDVEATLTKAWGAPNAHRIETIFRNSTQQALNAGRWRQMHEPDVLRFRPFGMFDAVDDSRTTPICKACDGTIRRLDDPWWTTHAPPLHHRCRSGIRNIRESEAKRRGITETPPDVDAPEGFGKPPTEADWEPVPSDYHPALFAEYQRKRSKLEDSGVRHRIPLKDD